MTVKTLYVYTRPDGGTDISPIAPEEGTAYETRHRLIADEGKILTDGKLFAYVIDTNNPDTWKEIEDDGSADRDGEEEITAAEALRIITGEGEN